MCADISGRHNRGCYQFLVSVFGKAGTLECRKEQRVEDTAVVCAINNPLLRATSTTLIQAADGGPGIDADRGRELLEAEPRAGLVRAHLKRDTLTENIDGQLEILCGRRAKRERLLDFPRPGRIGAAG